MRPDRPSTATASGPGSSGQVSLVSATGATATVRTAQGLVTLTRTGVAEPGGVEVDVYAAAATGARADSLPTRLSFARIAALNGEALPIGLKPTGTGASVAYTDRVRVTAQIEPRTGTVVAYRSVETVSAAVVRDASQLALRVPVSTTTTGLSTAAAAGALGGARTDLATLDRRDLLAALAWTSAVLGLILLLAGAGLGFAPRRREPEMAPVTPPQTLVRS